MRVRLRTPLSVFLNVTSRCNLACSYCSADARHDRAGELDRECMRHLVQDLIGCRVCRVIITGGEPFVRDDLFDILESLRVAGIMVQINTNGTLLRPAACERLVSLGVTSVSVSLDGAPAAVNDATRGRGSYAAARRGIGHLVDAGIHPAVLLTLTRLNYRALVETVGECKRLGASALIVNPMSRIGRARGCYEELSLTHGEWNEAAAAVDELRTSCKGFTFKAGFSYWGKFPERVAACRELRAKVPVRSFLPCDAAKTFCAIAADGSVLPCNKFENYSCGNVQQQSLREIWQSEAMGDIRRLGDRRVADAPICGCCRYRSVCSGGCRADAFTRFGCLDAPDPACAILPDAAVHQMIGLQAVESATPCRLRSECSDGLL